MIQIKAKINFQEEIKNISFFVIKRFYKTINDHRILCTCNYKLSTTAHSSITHKHASASGACNIHTYLVTYFIGSYYTGRLFKVNATSNNLIVN